MTSSSNPQIVNYIHEVSEVRQSGNIVNITVVMNITVVQHDQLQPPPPSNPLAGHVISRGIPLLRPVSNLPGITIGRSNDAMQIDNPELVCLCLKPGGTASVDRTVWLVPRNPTPLYILYGVCNDTSRLQNILLCDTKSILVCPMRDEDGVYIAWLYSKVDDKTIASLRAERMSIHPNCDVKDADVGELLRKITVAWSDDEQEQKLTAVERIKKLFACFCRLFAVGGFKEKMKRDHTVETEFTVHLGRSGNEMKNLLSRVVDVKVRSIPGVVNVFMTRFPDKIVHPGGFDCMGDGRCETETCRKFCHKRELKA